MAEHNPEQTNKLLSPAPGAHGPIAGVVIVVLILLIGGLYFGLDRIKKNEEVRNQIPSIPNSTTTLTIIKTSTTTYYQYSTTTSE